MENCIVCGKPVADAPPNVPVHDKCWTEAIEESEAKVKLDNNKDREYDEG